MCTGSAGPLFFRFDLNSCDTNSGILKMDVTETVDVRGQVCPMPTIRLGQAIRRVQLGHVVEVWTDDPGAQENMQAWSKNTGHELLSSTQENGFYKYRFCRSR